MVVVHIAAGALGVLAGLYLFSGYGLIWMLTFLGSNRQCGNSHFRTGNRRDLATGSVATGITGIGADPA